jgi:6-phosphogluconolactonase (cycloisomerase 2 family)
MWRSIGSVTLLALLMVGCGGGGGGSPPAGYTVGGTVIGLTGSGLVLTSDFGGDLPVRGSGPFTFSIRVPPGQAFNVAVKTQPTSSPAQNCQVANGGGTMPAANVTDVDVTCTSGFTVGGTVSGLVGSGLTLSLCVTPQHGGIEGSPCHAELLIHVNGEFTMDDVFPANYTSGAYVAITQQPTSPAQHCLISNAKVSIQNANDTSVTVSCSTFLYATNAADNTLSAYNVDATTGALTAVGTPAAAGVTPHAVLGIQNEDKRYIFVGNEGSNDISAFAVNNTTGALTAVPGSPFAAGTDPQAMAFDGSSLYVANAGSDNVSVYNIDANSGALAAPSTFATGKNPTSITIIAGANTDFVYVANHGGSNDISAFRYLDFTPVPGSPFPEGGNPLSLALGAKGKFLYSANPDATNPSISGFTIDPNSGALSPLSGSPFPLPVSRYMATDQTGAYLYVTWGTTIVGYAIDAATGALTSLAGFPVRVGVEAYSITINPTNQLLYVADDGAAHISGFTLDASTGALTPMAGSPFPTGNHPEFIVTF